MLFTVCVMKINQHCSVVYICIYIILYAVQVLHTEKAWCMGKELAKLHDSSTKTEVYNPPKAVNLVAHKKLLTKTTNTFLSCVSLHG